MIIHKHVKIFDKNMVHFFFTALFWHIDCIFFLIFVTKNSNGNRILFFFSTLGMSLILTGNFISLESSSLAKSLLAFVILLGLWSTGCQYPAKHLLKHSSSSVFAMSFLDVLIFLGNFM